MDVARALGVLGLDTTASWDDIRGAYRRLIRTHHPDVADVPRAARATDITEAYATLERATAGGRDPLDPSARPSADPRSQRPRSARVSSLPAKAVTLDVGGLDVVDALAQGAAALGRVGPVDHESGIVIVTLGPPRWTPSQLLAEVGSTGGRATVEFTLESLGRDAAPSIEAVVSELARNLPRA